LIGLATGGNLKAGKKLASAISGKAWSPAGAMENTNTILSRIVTLLKLVFNSRSHATEDEFAIDRAHIVSSKKPVIGRSK
jgi:hypothetical protein